MTEIITTCQSCQNIVTESNAIRFPPASSFACPKCKGPIFFNEIKEEKPNVNKSSDSTIWLCINLYIIIGYVIIIILFDFKYEIVLIGGAISLECLFKIFKFLFLKDKNITSDDTFSDLGVKRKISYIDRSNEIFGRSGNEEVTAIPISLDFIKVILVIGISITVIYKILN